MPERNTVAFIFAVTEEDNPSWYIAYTPSCTIYFGIFPLRFLNCLRTNNSLTRMVHFINKMGARTQFQLTWNAFKTLLKCFFLFNVSTWVVAMAVSTQEINQPPWGWSCRTERRDLEQSRCGFWRLLWDTQLLFLQHLHLHLHTWNFPRLCTPAWFASSLRIRDSQMLVLVIKGLIYWARGTRCRVQGLHLNFPTNLWETCSDLCLRKISCIVGGGCEAGVKRVWLLRWPCS